jgi:glycosyltransferase involved in cell wall biosynthesis
MADAAVSVVVCTRNRAAYLRDCLSSLVAGALRDADEVLVVDNGSSDDTAAVATDAASRFRALRYVFEPRAGLSHARNAGIEHATGEVLAYLDDDALVTPGWRDAVASAYARWPDLGGLAGRVELRWRGPRPEWLAPRLETWYAGFDKGDRPRLLEADEYPFGANMSVRRDMATAIGGFATELGYVGRGLIGSEEREFFHRVMQKGGTLGYEPAALVYHQIGDARLTRRWLLRRTYSQGRADARMERREGMERRALLTSGLAAIGRGTARGWRADTQRTWRAENRASQLMLTAAGRARRLGYGIEAVVTSFR